MDNKIENPDTPAWKAGGQLFITALFAVFVSTVFACASHLAGWEVGLNTAWYMCMGSTALLGLLFLVGTLAIAIDWVKVQFKKNPTHLE